ncbi:hypothetical protein SAMD00019534_122110 [Acytostelium subglobosum LB1]|uniref:hypothetical protein n=1 Tax=Acytostelium subglobosum LB1 TaxID=1410327 RepID=UPI000644FBD4|nr:hypothetical protein SAMD00019534_122110 [Acytostelium subglobosum LB1]GAM29035.1 hypothetical protein SAMD00019534_122110 [Acytostelium subglobosum LB1]|eukprot:XP_012748041.1 hypothetical protein SAMD00019534_122110 [Acytostelium subglobosum LB1]
MKISDLPSDNTIMWITPSPLVMTTEDRMMIERLESCGKRFIYVHPEDVNLVNYNRCLFILMSAAQWSYQLAVHNMLPLDDIKVPLILLLSQVTPVGLPPTCLKDRELITHSQLANNYYLAADTRRCMGNNARQTDTSTGPIYFYHQDQPYYQFTNFFQAPFELDGLTWRTAEHYFQAQKFVPHHNLVQYVNELRTPREAFEFSRNPKVKDSLRHDWRDIKDGIMYKAVQAKFNQSPELMELLINTGKRDLVEHTRNDNYWGDGGDGTGQNRLGLILMKVRSELQDRYWHSSSSTSVPAL